MKWRILPTLLLLLLAAASAIAAPSRVYVKMEQNVDAIETLSRVTGASKAKQILPIYADGDAAAELSRWYAVDLSDDSNENLAALKQNAGVALVERMPKRTTQADRAVDGVSLDPMLQFQWHLPAVSAFSAWDRVPDASSVVVAILDNGCDMNHPDLVSAYWTNSAEANGSAGVDDDGNGYVDDIHGYDFFGTTGNDPDGNPDAPDDGSQPSHGTHCAGIAAATVDNGVGVAGVAPGARVMAVRIGEDRDIYYPVEGIVYAASNGADVISMSFSGDIESVFERDAVNYALEQGVVLLAAAGNSGSSTRSYPAGYDGVISVGATGQDGGLAYFSNRGPWVDIAAPGVSILSTAIDGYLYLDGTSMATPLVAGIVALIRAESPNLTPAQVRARLGAGATDIPYAAWLVNAGAVDAYRSVVSDRPTLLMVDPAVVNSIVDRTTVGFSPRLALFGKDAASVQFGLSSASDGATLFSSTATSYSNVSVDDTLNPQFDIHFDSGARRGEHDFLLSMNADGWRDSLRVSIPYDSPWQNQETANMTASVTDFGAIGYRDVINNRTNSEGVRLLDHPAGYLFHGSVMISDGDLVSDNAYGADNGNKFDFAPMDDGRLETVSSNEGLQILRAVYTDFGVNLDPVGVEVTQTTTSDPNGDDIVRFDFDVRRWNTGSDNYNVALYFDWDIGDAFDNVVKYNESTGLSYMVGPTGAAGMMPVTNDLNATPFVAAAAINNPEVVYSSTYDTFSDAEKNAYLATGTDLATGTTPTDWSHLVAVRIADVTPTISKRASFLMMAAPNETALLTLAQNQAGKAIRGTASGLGTELPSRITLSPAWPNPFNNQTRLTLELPENSGMATVAIYDLLGRRVRSLEPGANGRQQLVWDGRSDTGAKVASGVYLVRASAGNQTAERRITLVK